MQSSQGNEISSIVERIPCEVDASPFAQLYLKTKRERCGHLFASTFANIAEVA
jgi:GTP cyclohydrolase II